jgi:hypothetical protein
MPRKRRKQAAPIVAAPAEGQVEKRLAAGLESATAERLAKAGPDAIEIGEASLTQRIIDAPLDRLWKAGTITKREFEAGERFRNDAYLAQIEPSPPSVDVNRTGTGFGPRPPPAFASQAIADARERFRHIGRKIPERSLVWSFLYLGLVREQGFEALGELLLGRKDRESAVAAAKAGMRVALAALADQYGG